MNNLIKTLEAHIPISKQVINFLGEKAVKRNFRARVKIVSPNQNQGSLLFLTKGITRNYYLSETREWTSRFGQPGDFVVSVENFLLNLPCNEFIESCTPIEFIEIPKIHYLQLLADNPELLIIVSNTVNECLRASLARAHDWHMQSATERYNSFAMKFPDLFKKVQLNHIASYLGVTPNNLSRIRNQKRKESIH